MVIQTTGCLQGSIYDFLLRILIRIRLLKYVMVNLVLASIAPQLHALGWRRVHLQPQAELLIY